MTRAADGPARGRDGATLGRPTRLVLLTGGAVSILGAVTVGAFGADGGGSLAAAFLGAALTAAIAGITALIEAVRGELRARPVPRRAIGVGLGLLLLAPVSLVLAAGAAGTG
ncbi:MAG: hypothetical protein WEB09_05375 [Nitriliruptor sp.]